MIILLQAILLYALRDVQSRGEELEQLVVRGMHQARACLLAIIAPTLLPCKLESMENISVYNPQKVFR